MLVCHQDDSNECNSLLKWSHCPVSSSSYSKDFSGPLYFEICILCYSGKWIIVLKGKQKLAMKYPFLINHISIPVFIVSSGEWEDLPIKLYYVGLGCNCFSFMVDFKMTMS